MGLLWAWAYFDFATRGNFMWWNNGIPNILMDFSAKYIICISSHETSEKTLTIFSSKLNPHQLVWMVVLNLEVHGFFFLLHLAATEIAFK